MMDIKELAIKLSEWHCSENIVWNKIVIGREDVLRERIIEYLNEAITELQSIQEDSVNG